MLKTILRENKDQTTHVAQAKFHMYTTQITTGDMIGFIWKIISARLLPLTKGNRNHLGSQQQTHCTGYKNQIPREILPMGTARFRTTHVVQAQISHVQFTNNYMYRRYDYN